MLSTCRSSSLVGLEAYEIEIEFDIGQGLPAIVIVGLPDTAVRESKDRVRSALINSAFIFPEKRITINLAPADIKKEGPIYDLPIALGVLAANNVIEGRHLAPYCILGELALDGSIRPVKGVLPMAVAMFHKGIRKMILPAANADEAAVVRGLDVYPVASLSECVAFLRGEYPLKPRSLDIEELFKEEMEHSDSDFSDVRGQNTVKRAIEVAVAGGHNLLLIGPPGSGKTMLAKRIATIIPRLTLEESLITSKIHSVAAGPSRRNGGLLVKRPFRFPHHTISNTGLIGGGQDLRPGEVSMAHNGVLFLDEFPEFRRDALEVLREPLEERQVTITRAAGSVTYPANFILVASMNPCPCGFLTDPRKDCLCSPHMVQKYRNKISGPLLDRIDIHVEVPAVPYDEFKSRVPAESSAAIRERVARARSVQAERFRDFPIRVNADMATRLIRKTCQLDSESEILLKAAFQTLNLSARAHDRILKVARTLADLDGQERILAQHLAEAIQYRALDRSVFN